MSIDESDIADDEEAEEAGNLFVLGCFVLTAAQLLFYLVQLVGFSPIWSLGVAYAEVAFAFSVKGRRRRRLIIPWVLILASITVAIAVRYIFALGFNVFWTIIPVF